MRRTAKVLTRPVFREVTPEAVKTTYNELALEYSSPGDLSQLMANTTVKHYLGGEWLDRYVHYKSPHARYLRVDINASAPGKMKAMMRYWEFAETLLNLQNIEGFEAVLDELEHGKIESACGEFDVARMIAFHGLKFCFVKPTRGTKRNYDFEIRYPDGLKVCAEAAAKFEATLPRARSIRHSLRASRAQLPDDELSIIFVKVPEAWISDIELAEQIRAIALDYCANPTTSHR
jgi:hypothetical protein